MHLSTTWYHCTRSVSAGTSDGLKSRPRTSSFHFLFRYGSSRTVFGLVSRLLVAMGHPPRGTSPPSQRETPARAGGTLQFR